MQPKLEYNSHMWAGAAKLCCCLHRVHRRAQVLVGDDESVTRTLEHRRNVGCIVLMYRYIQDVSSPEIRAMCSAIKLFNRATLRSQHSHHPSVLELPGYRTTHYRVSSLFSRAARLWNNLATVVFPSVTDVSIFKANVHKHCSFPSPINLPNRHSACTYRWHSLSGWSNKKNAFTISRQPSSKYSNILYLIFVIFQRFSAFLFETSKHSMFTVGWKQDVSAVHECLLLYINFHILNTRQITLCQRSL